MFSLFRKKPAGSKAAMIDTHSCIDDLTGKVVTHLDHLKTAVSSPTAKTLADVETTFAYVRRATEAIVSLNRVVSRPTKPDIIKQHAYCVSSLFLEEARDFLTTDPHQRERMVYVTGPITDDGTRVLSCLKQVKMSDQNAVYVKADVNASMQTLEQLTTGDGHELHAMWHNHNLVGKDGTRPSQTDLNHQHRMVKFGMPHVLGGIFGADGYVRIFTTDEPFTLTVYGNGVEVIEDNPREKILKLAMKEDSDVSPSSE